MATEDSEPPATAASASSRPAPAGKRPRWLHWLVIIILIPVAAVVFLIVLGMFAAKPKPSDATSVLRTLANDPELAGKAGLEGKFAETSAPGAPAGIRAEFLWTLRPGALDAEIATFDTLEHTAAGFELFKAPELLLVPADDGDTNYSGFDQGEADGPAEKRFYCALNTKEFACGSIAAGLPVIVILREPPEGALPAADPSDPMGGFARLERTMNRTDRMGREMRQVDATLKQLGITAQPPS